MRPDIARYARLYVDPTKPESPRRSRRSRVTRRAFLETTAAGAAFVLSFRLDGSAEGQEPPKEEKKPPNPFDAWVKIATDGTVTLILAKTEMGQGAMTALPMILAEELDVDWSKVKVEQALSNPAIYNHGTGGSGSVKDSYTPLRQAGAAARAMLVGAAADRLKVEASALKTDKGVVLGPAGQRIAYAELVADAAKRPIPDFKTLALKDEKTFRIVGTNVPRVDMPAKVDGSARLRHRRARARHALRGDRPLPDLRRKGRELRRRQGEGRARRETRRPDRSPPAPPGPLRPAGWRWSPRAPGPRSRAARPWSSSGTTDRTRARAAPRSAHRWRRPSSAPGKVCRNDGDCDKALAGAAKKVEAVYELPFVAHACMEPMNATVHVKPDGVEAWLACQDSAWPLGVMAEIAGVKPEQVKVHTTLLGGGFGRKLPRRLRGGGRPGQQGRAGAGAGRLVPRGRHPARLLPAHVAAPPRGRRRRLGQARSPGTTACRPPPSPRFWEAPDKAKPESSEVGGAVNLGYAIPNMRMEYAVAKTAVPVMWWRSVEHSMTAFVNECFLDELAHLAGQDPLKFRLALLAEPRKVKFPEDSQSVLETPRLKAVLELAGGEVGMGQPAAAGARPRHRLPLLLRQLRGRGGRGLGGEGQRQGAPPGDGGGLRPRHPARRCRRADGGLRGLRASPRP